MSISCLKNLPLLISKLMHRKSFYIHFIYRRQKVHIKNINIKGHKRNELDTSTLL